VCDNISLVTAKTTTVKKSRRWHAYGALAAAAMVGVGLTVVASAFGTTPTTCRALGRLRIPNVTQLFSRVVEPVKLTARALTKELRQKGYNECYPFDFVGLGPYSPYRKLRTGRIAIPQRGGHTADYGYDVVVHFHGQNAMRMTLAQVARGIAFVGIDLGNGSGAYSDAFAMKSEWPLLREDIDRALQVQSGHAEAHARHVALMAWSAGYGAVNEILKYHTDDIDAVVLLDGLHAAWDPRFGRTNHAEHITAGPIAPTVEYARQAMAGEKLFIFTHSEIDPVLYPSTSLTAGYILSELGLTMKSKRKSSEPFGQLGAVDVLGLHVWSFQGNDKPAHCTHLTHVEHAVRDILEPTWDTPKMDRDVPNTPAPRLGPSAPTLPAVSPNADTEGQPQARVSWRGQSTTG
jgi:hypothetical protein